MLKLNRSVALCGVLVGTLILTACGGAPDIRQLDQLASFEACRRSAVARAVVAVDSPMLTALAHRGSPASFAAR